MLMVWNRCELTSCFTMEECRDITSRLRENQIECTVKTINRSSPSVLNRGTRPSCGTLFEDNSYRYRIYVKRADREAAKEVIGISDIR